MTQSTSKVAPETSSGASSASPSSASSSSGVQMRAALRGMDFDAQAHALMPDQVAPVQAKGGDASGAVHAAAERGTAGSGASLPHLDAIQSAFGHHDVTGVQAHVGGAAAEASQAMGAEAYASGNDVAFGGAPDVHTAAHEAAHVIQQQSGVSLAGGVGQAGDAYEQHADRVADAVVAGNSAEPILNQMTGGGAGAEVQAKGVQQKSDSDVVVQRDAVAMPDGRTVDPGRTPTDFETEARAFEEKLPAVAAPKATGVLEALCQKALEYIKNKVKSTTDRLPEIESGVSALLAKCGEVDPTRAGGVRPEAVREILTTAQQRQTMLTEAREAGTSLATLAAPPSIREQMTFLRNFGRAIFAPNLLKDGGEVTGRLLGATPEETRQLSTRVEAARAAAATRTPGPKDNLPGGTNVLDIVDAVPSAASRGAEATRQGADPSAIVSGSGPAASRDPEAIRSQANARVDTKDVAAVTGTPAQSAASGRQAGPISGAESTDPLAITPREATQQGITSATDVLKWSEGDRVWMANETNTWVTAIRELQLPFAAGPSGMTNSTLNAAQMLGMGDRLLDTRMACIAFLLNIHAHSLAEVLAAGAGFGLPFTAGQTMYENIPPLSPEELRSCGKDRKFPRELAEESAAAAATAATGGPPAAGGDSAAAPSTPAPPTTPPASPPPA